MTGWAVMWVLGVCAVLAVLANHRYHWAAGWRYSWLHAQHVLERTEREPVPAPEYGSMILAEERGLAGCNTACWSWRQGLCDELCQPGQYPDPLHDEPDWREQTAAGLSPEALDGQPLDKGRNWCDSSTAAGEGKPVPPAAAIDSGPGNASPSVAPGPDPGAWLAPALAGIARRYGMENGPPPSRLADTGDIFLTHLLADGAAFMRAQDDATVLYCSRYRSARAQDRLDLAAALA